MWNVTLQYFIALIFSIAFISVSSKPKAQLLPVICGIIYRIRFDHIHTINYQSPHFPKPKYSTMLHVLFQMITASKVVKVKGFQVL